jgi:hypothetical protein
MADGAPRRGFLWRLASKLVWAACIFIVGSIGELEWMYRRVIRREGRPEWMPMEMYRDVLRRLLVYARWRQWVVDNRWLIASGV